MGANCDQVDDVRLGGCAAIRGQPHHWHSTGMASVVQLGHQKRVVSEVATEGEERCKIMFHKFVVEL